MENRLELQYTRTQRGVFPLPHTSFRSSGASQYYGRTHVHGLADTESGNAQFCQSTLMESISNNELGPTEKGSEHTPATAHWSRREIDWWIKELSALLISLSSLLCIILTLRIYDGRPLPDWPLSITINSMVSIFSTIMGMTLLMPLAEGISQAKWLWFRKYHPLSDMEVYNRGSRGPWGALEMLWIVRWR